MEDIKKRTWAEISLGAVEHNYRSMRSRLGDGTRFLGVVKANSYGHGALQVAGLLEKLGCEYLAVACLDELRQLREGGIKLPVLILGFTPPEYAPEIAGLNGEQAVGSLDMAKQLSAALAGTGKTLRVHFKLETGMGRTGFRAFGDWSEKPAAEAMNLPGLEPVGVFTHFCVSDADEPKREFTHEQFSRFQNAIGKIETAAGKKFQIHHCTNSGAMLSFPETYCDMVRPGVLLYGMYPGSDRNIPLIPVMSLYSRVAYVEHHEPGDTISYGRTYKVEEPGEYAVLPIGYADGLHRVLSNKLEVMINGHICRQVGNICMDMCMVNVTGLGVKSGDVAEIFGRNMTVDRLAELGGTINYEVTCDVSPRVPRVYVD